MDRTCWNKRKRHVNILMVSVVFRGRAIPLYWHVTDRAGNSSLSEWKQVITPVITHLQARPGLCQTPLIVVADREFASPRLAEWLKTTYQVESVIRLKRSAYLCDQALSMRLADLLQYFPRGTTRVYRHITVTQSSTFLVHVVITWSPQYDEPLIIMSTSEEAATSIRRYRQRFGIEPMFKDQKSNGFDLERTKVTDPKRLETLLIVMAEAQSNNNLFQNINLSSLAEDLSRLKNEMQNMATTPEQEASTDEVAKAEDAARRKETSKVVGHLKAAGKFALECPKEIGTDIAAEVIKKSIGI